MEVFIGTSGYNYKDWKERFYPKDLPQKNWLKYYSAQFETVEINATFYRNFGQSIYEKWYMQTPDHFKFTIKGSRLITHIKRVKEVNEELDIFFESVKALNGKIANVLWQFPASFIRKSETEKNFISFLKLLSQPRLTRPKDVNQVIEFRHNSWFTKEIYNLLDKHKIGFVISDSHAFPSVEKVTGDMVYIRFHGPGKLYSTPYTTEQLKVWAKKIKKYKNKHNIYCYFNNDVSGYAIQNAKELIELVER